MSKMRRMASMYRSILANPPKGEKHTEEDKNVVD
jgi:hypothetical protein